MRIPHLALTLATATALTFLAASPAAASAPHAPALLTAAAAPAAAPSGLPLLPDVIDKVCGLVPGLPSVPGPIDLNPCEDGPNDEWDNH
ncbi:hypothetical protein [Nocardiopsis sp. NPDC006938]|uniref:hypothetical protein n=1 Tax=Nocardiopsis sp. NPDC006938 TaxID=3364337 RepID=UPI0036BFB80D